MATLVERACQIDEVRRVVGAIDAAAHHLVVARVLAFEPQTPARNPEQGLNQ